MKQFISLSIVASLAACLVAQSALGAEPAKPANAHHFGRPR